MNLFDNISQIFKQKEITPNEHSGNLRDLGNYKRDRFFDLFDGFDSVFNGETDSMEFGDTKVYSMDYYTLRERSWQLYAENKGAKIIIDRLVTFSIGSGLRLQAEPNTFVLETFGIKEDFRMWKKQVENFYEVFTNSKNIDYTKQENFGGLQTHAYKHSLVGGDCLVIEHLDKDTGWLNYEIIDGSHVMTPIDKTPDARIIDGVEVNAKGEHIAYYVRVKKDGDNLGISYEFKRVLARSKTTGRLKAWLVYGSKYRSSQTRGMPILGVCMQEAKQLDRFGKAELSTKEANAKFVATIEHDEYSTGENPLKPNQLRSRNVSSSCEVGGSYSNAHGDSIADKLKKLTTGIILNMGRGQHLKRHDGQKQATDFTTFYDNIFKYLSSCCEIPPEVALMVFGNNFSASRASLKMFEEILNVKRSRFAEQFNKPIYESFVIYWTSLGYIKSMGFIKGYTQEKAIILESYFVARFTGKPIPHIDPKKEVEASLLKLNPEQPLSTHERECELLGLGDFEEIYTRFAQERELIDKLTPLKSEVVIQDTNLEKEEE